MNEVANIDQIFGLNMAGCKMFWSHLAAGSGAPDVYFEMAVKPTTPPVYPDASLKYASAVVNRAGDSVSSVFRLDAHDVIRITDVADFHLEPDQIICQPFADDVGDLIEIHLLGTVLSFFLERQGIPMLHTSAIAHSGQAITFASSNKGGKSSLAASFMQAGCPLLTDDILPVEQINGKFIGRPGYPTMRMWPAEAEHFLGHHESLNRVHPALSKRRVAVGPNGFGDFCDVSRPLRVIYLPERRDVSTWGTQIRVEPVTAAEAMIELVRNSFIPRMVQAMGWQPQRLTTFAALAQQVPIRRLTYPSGFEYLPNVREAILADITQL